MDCTYCGCSVDAHDPLYLSADPGGEPTAQFCNYGCLLAHIETAELAVGTSCNWTPTE